MVDHWLHVKVYTPFKNLIINISFPFIDVTLTSVYRSIWNSLVFWRTTIRHGMGDTWQYLRVRSSVSTRIMSLVVRRTSTVAYHRYVFTYFKGINCRDIKGYWNKTFGLYLCKILILSNNVVRYLTKMLSKWGLRNIKF